MVTIAVDAMGGDHAPKSEVEGAVQAKRDSSLRVASRLVRDGIAQGFLSAGNTGAVMATAKMVQGVIPGVDRPALAGVFPTVQRNSPVVVVDVGANVDCSPRMLS